MNPSVAMRWRSATSMHPESVDGAQEIGDQLGSGDPGPPDLLLLFFGTRHVPHVEAMAHRLRERLSPACFAAVSARGVVGSEKELEVGQAFSALAAWLPDVQVQPFVMTREAWIDAVEDPLEFARCAPHVAGAELVVLLADPFSFDIERALEAFNRHAPGVRVVGGMASAGPRRGANALLLNDWIAKDGGIGLAFSGALSVDVVVSQGCRPVGPALRVTRCEGNLVHELDGQPALERAEQVLRSLSEKEQKRLKHGLYIGRAAKPEASGHGDYLIRNLLGADRDRGVMAVGDRMTDGEHIRLHVRDGEAAREDLEMMLSPQQFDSHPAAALMFLCNGRGRGLYGEADGDIRVLQSVLGGDVPVAGMFCAGEIGPVGTRNLLHGHTASIAIVRGGRARDR